MKLYSAFVRPIFKDPKGKAKDEIEEILKKTGGHPLSIEIIAKSIRSLHQLGNISESLGMQPRKAWMMNGLFGMLVTY